MLERRHASVIIPEPCRTAAGLEHNWQMCSAEQGCWCAGSCACIAGNLGLPARLRRSAQSSHGARAERVGAPLGSAQRGRGAAEAAAEPLGSHAQALADACAMVRRFRG